MMLGRRPGGDEHAEPGAGLVVEAALLESRHVREQLGAAIGRDRDGLERAAAEHAEHGQHARKKRLHLVGHRAQRGRTAAAVRHMHHPGTGHVLEQLGCEMRAAADAVGAVIELARARLHIGDEFGERADRQRRRDREHRRRIRDQRNRLEIALRLERELLVQRGIGGEADARDQQRVSVWLGADRGQGAEIGVGAGTVEHDERLAETLAEPVADQPRQQLGPAAGCERNDDLHRAGGIILCARRCGDRCGDENSTQQEHAGFKSEQ